MKRLDLFDQAAHNAAVQISNEFFQILKENSHIEIEANRVGGKEIGLKLTLWVDQTKIKTVQETISYV